MNIPISPESLGMLLAVAVMAIVCLMLKVRQLSKLLNENRCSVEGCFRGRAARGMCSMHYARFRTHGDIEQRPRGRVRKEPFKEPEPKGSGWKKPKGFHTNNAKVTEDDVREIRRLHAEGSENFSSLSRRYGVSPRSVASVVKRETWKHVE